MRGGSSRRGIPSTRNSDRSCRGSSNIYAESYKAPSEGSNGNESISNHNVSPDCHRCGSCAETLFRLRESVPMVVTIVKTSITLTKNLNFTSLRLKHLLQNLNRLHGVDRIEMIAVVGQ